MKRRHLFLLLTALISLCTLSACSDDEGDSTAETSAARPVVTVLYAPDGLGDGGYNDSISRGIYEAQLAVAADGSVTERFLVNSFSPEDSTEAEAFLKEWLASYRKSGVRQLLVLASSDYEALARKYSSQIPDEADYAVILLESRATDLPVHTFHLPFYGVSYEAGLLAKQLVFYHKALVMTANDEDEMLKDGAQGFCDGYLAATDSLPDTFCIVEGGSGGYDRANDVYILSNYLAEEYDFVYPLIGGSIQGLLQHNREYFGQQSFYIAGIDADMSSASKLVPFSVVKHVGRVLRQQITSWLDGATLPRHQSFGYTSGQVEVILHWDEGEYFHGITAAQREEIIRKEEAYESKKQ